MGLLIRNKIYLVSIIWGVLFCQTAFAAKWATVIADYAIVYSDIQMSSKIGYIKKGKKVRVGEKLRNNGKLLPIIVNKRVAYIEIKNLQTSTRLEALQSATQRLKKQSKKKKTEDRFSLYASSMYSAVMFPESATAESQVGMLFLGFGLKGYKSMKDKRSGFRGGVDYLIGKSGDHQLTVWSLPADYYFKFMKTSYADIYLYGGGSVIPYAEYKLGSLFTLNGYGFGAQAGAEMIFKYKGYAIHLDGSYQYQKLMGFTINGDNPDYPSVIEPSTHGMKFLAALSFSY